MKVAQRAKALVTAVAASLLATSVHAQVTASRQGEVVPPDKTGGITDIIVTANKSVGTAQRLPVAIAVVSGAQLSQSGATNIADLIKVAPAIQFTPIRQKAIPFIRGVGQGISAGNADPAVAINLDGAYLPAEMSNLAFFDVERVEVLYGPQGTLYGRNAVGGAINVISRRPGKSIAADGSIELGNYHSVLATAGVDLPVTPALGVRIAMLRNSHDGYFTNGMSDADQWAVRGSALLEPIGGTTSISFIGSYSQQRGFGSGTQNLPPQTSNPWFLPYDPATVPLFTRANAGTATLQISHDFGGGTNLTSITGFARINEHTNFTAFLNRPGNVQYVDYTLRTSSLNQELRLSGSADKVSWIAGIYAYDTTNAETSAVRAQLLPTLQFQVGPWRQHSQGLAAFGQLTYSLMPNLRVTAGGRYSYDTRRLTGTNINFLNTGATPPTPTVAYSGDRSDGRPDFKIGLEFDAASRSLLYATFQTGYSNGGFSTAQTKLGLGIQSAAQFAPMTVKAFTLGSKNRFLDGKLQLNAELFYNRYRDYQVSSRSLQTGQATVYNAARAETYGAQFDARAQVTQNDEFGFTFSLLHAKFVELIIWKYKVERRTNCFARK